MPDVTVKAPPEVFDQFAGITGLFPLSPSAGATLDPLTPGAGITGAMPGPSNGGAPLTPNWSPEAPSTLGTGAPDMGTAALPPIAPASAPGSMAAPPPAEGSSDYYRNQLQSDIQRPKYGAGGTLGKIGGWAASILTPHIAAMIPQTPLGRIAAINRDTEMEQGAQKSEEEAQAARSAEQLKNAQIEAMGSMVPVKVGDQTFYLHEKDAANVIGKQVQGGATVEAAGERGQAQRDVAGTKAQSASDIEKSKEQSQQNIEAGREKTQRDIANLRAETSKLVAQEKIKATDDPNKLTVPMKTMKQQAQSVLPELDNALAETDRVAGQLGPVQGRWNDFWQGKVGTSDPAYAHYKDEISFISTAITLAHARGRMSNELFEHFQQMFDAGKQSPENMKQALEVSKEWMNSYAQMGEPGSPVGGGGTKNATPPGNGPAIGTVEGGYRFKGGDPAKKNSWEKVQ